MDDENKAARGPNSSGWPRTIIIAEQYPLARAALADLFTSDGWRALEAHNFGQAISYIDNTENLAVVLVDLDMPGWRSLIRHTIKASNSLLIGMEGIHSIEKADLRRCGLHQRFKKPIVYGDLWKAITADENFDRNPG
jgi:CheY-like chemotaxis protein